MAFKIGVMSDCFKLGPFEGVKKAAALGADGVQVYTVSGEMSPEEMDAGKRKDFRQLVADQGIVISALCGDMGGGFRNAEANPGNIARSKLIVDLAVDLGATIVTTHIGVVPSDSTDPAYAVMLAACKDIADYGAKAGITFAIETGPETGATLKGFLNDVDSPGLGVNLDPANLVMVVADDPAEATRTLGSAIVHTHAKDGIQIKPGDALATYHGGEGGGVAAEYKEVPLGEGGVDWDAYLAALTEVGYDGFLTIEREVGDDPAGDIERAISFLRGRNG